MLERLRKALAYEGELLPLDGNWGCMMILSMLANPFIGAQIFRYHILGGRPLSSEPGTALMIVATALGDVGLLILVITGAFSLMTRRDSVVRIDNTYSNRPTSMTIEYTTSHVWGDLAKRRGIYRVVIGAVFIATKWIPILIAAFTL